MSDESVASEADLASDPQPRFGAFSRKQFLRATALGAIGAAGYALAGPAAEPVDAAVVRSSTQGSTLLTLGGAVSGFVPSATGGAAVGEVVVESNEGISKKHIANVKYEDIRIQLGFDHAPPIYQWITDSWNRSYARKNGALDDINLQAKIVSMLEFSNALISEVSIPACDASAKDPAYMTLKLKPESTRTKVGDNSSVTKPIGKQKQWLPSNFRFSMSGLDTTKVAKIDSFTVKQNFTEAPGGLSIATLEPTKIEFPNLSITLTKASAQGWYDWHEDFVIKGNSLDSNEKTGTLTFLAPNLTTELAHIDFKHVGIFKIDDVEGDVVQRVKVELYVEEMDFVFPPTGGAT